MGDFDEALAALLDPVAPGLSSNTVARLVAVWADEYKRRKGSDLSARCYVYSLAAGTYFRPWLKCIILLGFYIILLLLFTLYCLKSSYFHGII